MIMTLKEQFFSVREGRTEGIRYSNNTAGRTSKGPNLLQKEMSMYRIKHVSVHRV